MLLSLLIIGLFLDLNNGACLPTGVCQYVSVAFLGVQENAFKYTCDGANYVTNFYNDTTSCNGDPDYTENGFDTEENDLIDSNAELDDCDLGCDDYVVLKIEAWLNGDCSGGAFAEFKFAAPTGCFNEGIGSQSIECSDSSVTSSYYFEPNCTGTPFNTTTESTTGCEVEEGSIFGETSAKYTIVRCGANCYNTIITFVD